MCFFSYVWLNNLDGPTLEQGQGRAAPLIQALDAYRNKNGAYPNDLQKLVPAYLVTLPRPAWRYDYFYRTDDDRSQFSLNFEERGQARGDGFCGYRSATAQWQCTDSSLTDP